MRYRAEQSGVALLMVLMIVAIASVIAVEMTSRQQLDIRRTANRQALQQAGLVAQGAENWAIGVLARDAKESKIDSLDEDWATVLPPMPVDGGQVGGFIEDLQAKFNLNNLLTQEGKISALEMERFQRLLAVLEISPQLAFAVQDWLDIDMEPTHSTGAEDDYYSSLEHPYRAANRPFMSISELRLVRDFDAETFAKIAPFVTALPQQTAININTAPMEVLRAIVPELDAAGAEALMEQRKESPFDKLEAFTENSVQSDKPINPEGLAVNSEYFRIQALIDIGRTHVRQFTWLHRVQTGQVTVWRRARGAE